MAYIEKRKNQAGEIASYRIVVSGGFDYSGKRIKHCKTWKPDKKMTERQLQKALARVASDFEREIEQGFQVDNRQTFAQYAEYVIALKERSGVKLRTVERYNDLLRRINQAIGHLKLTDLKPQHLNAFYSNLSEEGIRADGQKAIVKVTLSKVLKQKSVSMSFVAHKASISVSTVSSALHGNKINYEKAQAIAAALDMNVTDLFEVIKDTRPLSARTVQEYHRLLSTILSQAEKEMLIPFNPAARATPPKPENKASQYYQPDEMDAILNALDNAPLKWKAITYFLIDTGCRRGECCGLKWESVDLKAGMVTIERSLLYSSQRGIYEGSTKTGNVRTIYISQETIVLLKKYHIHQMEKRLLSGDRWNDTGYVFTGDTGLPVTPSSVTAWLSKFSKNNNLPHIHPHAFRHTAASMMISEGIDLVTTAHELGHNNATTTASIYAHQIEEAQAKATEARSRVFRHREQA